MPTGSGQREGRVPILGFLIGIGTRGEQQIHDVDVALMRGPGQRGGAVGHGLVDEGLLLE